MPTYLGDPTQAYPQSTYAHFQGYAVQSSTQSITTAQPRVVSISTDSNTSDYGTGTISVYPWWGGSTYPNATPVVQPTPTTIPSWPEPPQWAPYYPSPLSPAPAEPAREPAKAEPKDEPIPDIPKHKVRKYNFDD